MDFALKGAEVARRLVDPKTKEACAFYAALAAAIWDAITRGFHVWNVVFLASLCGISVAGVLSLLLGRTERKPDLPDAEETPKK